MSSRLAHCCPDCCGRPAELKKDRQAAHDIGRRAGCEELTHATIVKRTRGVKGLGAGVGAKGGGRRRGDARRRQQAAAAAAHVHDRVVGARLQRPTMHSNTMVRACGAQEGPGRLAISVIRSVSGKPLESISIIHDRASKNAFAILKQLRRSGSSYENSIHNLSNSILQFECGGARAGGRAGGRRRHGRAARRAPSRQSGCRRQTCGP